jgi:hypothetical protein
MTIGLYLSLLFEIDKKMKNKYPEDPDEFRN